MEITKIESIAKEPYLVGMLPREITKIARHGKGLVSEAHAYTQMHTDTVIILSESEVEGYSFTDDVDRIYMLSVAGIVKRVRVGLGQNCL